LKKFFEHLWLAVDTTAISTYGKSIWAWGLLTFIATLSIGFSRLRLRNRNNSHHVRYWGHYRSCSSSFLHILSFSIITSGFRLIST
jgi:hypothetical protein